LLKPKATRFTREEFSGSIQSTDVGAAKASFGLPGLSDYQFAVFMVCFLSAVLMAWLVGLISLFLVWRPGVYIFLAGVCAIWVVEYLRHRFIAAGFYSGVEMGLEIVIVTFALFGPAKHLFQRQGTE
jgi:hypothetical protein